MNRSSLDICLPGCIAPRNQGNRLSQPVYRQIPNGFQEPPLPPRLPFWPKCRITLWLGILFLLGPIAPTNGQVFIFDFEPCLPIRDYDDSGSADVRTLDTALYISEVIVTINLSGSSAFNGDYYMYLQHGDQKAILLNRPGRTHENSDGYGDPGFSSLTLADGTLEEGTSEEKDVHLYRQILFGTDSQSLMGSPLTGSWAPDGRDVDPSLVLDTNARTATLGAFAGLNSSGEWTLFVADLGPGNVGQLDSWRLEIHGIVIPELAATVRINAILLALLVLARFLRKKSRHKSANQLPEKRGEASLKYPSIRTSNTLH